MKKLIILALLAIAQMSVAQTVIRDGNTFKVEKVQDQKTSYFYEDKDGKKYPIYLTSKGKAYIYRVSKKTGKTYKYYLPDEISQEITKTQIYQ